MLWENKRVFFAKTLNSVSHVWWILKEMTSSLLCHPLLHLKIRACASLWFKEAIVFVSPKRLLVTPPCGHLWPLSAGSGCYFWGSLWTERAQISTAWSSQLPMGTLEGWDQTVVLQSWQTFDFSNSLSWKMGSKYRTSTSQKNKRTETISTPLVAPERWFFNQTIQVPLYHLMAGGTSAQFQPPTLEFKWSWNALCN